MRRIERWEALPARNGREWDSMIGGRYRLFVLVFDLAHRRQLRRFARSFRMVGTTGESTSAGGCQRRSTIATSGPEPPS